jgi:hypothetical protein
MTTRWHDPWMFDVIRFRVVDRDGASTHPGELIRKIVTHIAMRQSQWLKSPCETPAGAQANRFFRNCRFPIRIDCTECAEVVGVQEQIP